jgi:integral membrane protein (TIGR01906 family)
MLTLIILNKCKVISLVKPFGMSVAFISSISIFVVAFILGILVSIDFDTAFTIFHHLFFPGKDNWQFNPYKDQIILALPSQFFMNCALLIGASIVIISLTIIIVQLIKRKKNKKNEEE